MDEIHGFSGSVLVMRGPDVVRRTSTGPADTATGAECTPETRFQIASVSKQFAATAAMILAEDGALAVNAPIAEWLPDCPHHWQRMTVHQLLSPTSGPGHWPDLPGFDIDMPSDAGMPGDVNEFLERFAEVPPRGMPGSTWHYSSSPPRVRR